MFVFLYAFVRLFLGVKYGIRDPKFQAVTVVVLLTLLIGTIFYHNVEHWTFLDALYFSVVTLSTIGYGDLVPTTDLGKMFTVIYIFIGVGVFASFITLLAVNIGTYLASEGKKK